MKKVLSLVLVALMALAVCSAMAEGAGEGLYIGVVYKQSGNAYFEAGVTGFQKAADELGFTFDHDGPDDGSSDGQARIIENFVTQGVDALCISANDPAALVSVCQEAMEDGVYVLSWDAMVNAEGRNLDLEPASAQVIGVTLLDSIVNTIGGEGQIAIVSAMATASNQNEWIRYIEEALEENADGKYDGIEYLGVVYGDDEYTKSFDETQALLNKYPDLKGLIVPTTVGGPAVCKCIQDAGRDVKVTGLTLASDMAEFIKAGIAEETFLWNPIKLGYITGYAAVAMCNGELTGAVGESFEAGEIGTIEVVEGNGGTVAFLNQLNSFTVDTVDEWVDIL